QGQSVTVRELPVRRAAIYVPGGRAPYPSTVVMGAVTARVAGVEQIAVCAPGAHPVILAACALCGLDEVYRMGGAHAVAALAYGTARVPRVDVIAGPGNLYVQEAKRLVSGDVGIDGFLRPRDDLVLAEALAGRVRRAGCVFVGATGGTAFGDYVAGSNHSLPTGGAARFASSLSVRHFRRRMAEVHIGAAAPALARAGAPIARAEGFTVHAASMEARPNGTPR